ncbi:MAG: dihydrofolate reductase family protein [Patescibacteria group bacterium]|jgi:dihydrofolate reductase
MRKIIVLSFITLDGVMQAPGGPEEDTSGGFTYGGWVAPYFDEAAGEMMAKQMKPADLLLGRKTFDIFAAYWPEHADIWPGINDVTKYVVSTTLNDHTTDLPAGKHRWSNVVFLKTVDDIKKLKESEGGDIQVHGSSVLVQTLLKHDLVDELWLKTFPLTLGMGKRLFGDGTIPAAFSLIDSSITPRGVIFANYKRVGEVKTGTVGD